MAKTFFDFCMEQGDTALLEQWDTLANDSLTPHDVSPNSHKKIWWRCDKGHRWQSVVYKRKNSELGCPYCLGKKPIPGETDLASKHPILAAQWHPEKNGDLTPSQVTSGSARKVWWICEKGHSWNAMIKTRVRGNGCPVCANYLVLQTENDLGTTHPELARQWDYEKNGNLTPKDVAAGSHQFVWWLCDKGHSWRASIVPRSKGSGCPVCNGKKVIPGYNDLKTAFPDIASQWHQEKNYPLTADEVSPYSNKVVWWICSLDHEYRAAVAVRTNMKSGCPYCGNKRVLPGFNDLATLRPKLAKQWHPTLNGDLTPSMFTPGSSKYAWWICGDGHVWKACIKARGGKLQTGCPVCAGNVKRKKGNRGK